MPSLTLVYFSSQGTLTSVTVTFAIISFCLLFVSSRKKPKCSIFVHRAVVSVQEDVTTIRTLAYTTTTTPPLSLYISALKRKREGNDLKGLMSKLFSCSVNAVIPWFASFFHFRSFYVVILLVC